MIKRKIGTKKHVVTPMNYYAFSITQPLCQLPSVILQLLISTDITGLLMRFCFLVTLEFMDK